MMPSSMKRSVTCSLLTLVFICSSYAVRSGDIISNQWIVLFHPNITDDQVSTHISSLESRITTMQSASNTTSPNIQTSTFTFGDELKGYTTKVPSDTEDAHVQALVERIQGSDHVMHVESDRVVTLSMNEDGGDEEVDDQLLRWYGPWHRLHVIGDYVEQIPAPWNLVRVSHKSYHEFMSSTEYIYPSSAGSGATVYIVDTGVDVTHPELAERAFWGTSFVKGRNSSDMAYVDDNAHGTHVAGIIASTNYGVAKQAVVVAVKVMNWEGVGSTSTILAGLEWIYNHVNNTKNNIINASLRISASRAIDVAAGILINQKGIAWSSAAGNSGSNACANSPNNIEGVCTVGASDDRDKVAVYSNQGNCVDIFAPGSKVKSTIPINMGTYGIKSGTSMAAPHVSGLLALARSLHHEMTPYELNDYIFKFSTGKGLGNVNSLTPNRLAYTVLG